MLVMVVMEVMVDQEVEVVVEVLEHPQDLAVQEDVVVMV
jgi:hypothetical protein